MIIRYRDRLGGFAAAEQLNEIEGIPESALAFIHIDANHIHKLDINKLNLNQLRKHPYLILTEHLTLKLYVFLKSKSQMHYAW